MNAHSTAHAHAARIWREFVFSLLLLVLSVSGGNNDNVWSVIARKESKNLTSVAIDYVVKYAPTTDS